LADNDDYRGTTAWASGSLYCVVIVMDEIAVFLSIRVTVKSPSEDDYFSVLPVISHSKTLR
jgi:hypothetical protein